MKTFDNWWPITIWALVAIALLVGCGGASVRPSHMSTDAGFFDTSPEPVDGIDTSEDDIETVDDSDAVPDGGVDLSDGGTDGGTGHKPKKRKPRCEH